MSKEVIKCIEEAKVRFMNPKNKMGYSEYITYYVKRHELSMQDDELIRTEVSKYVDENITVLFPVSFTVNGI